MMQWRHGWLAHGSGALVGRADDKEVMTARLATSHLPIKM
jgi:hypothetical protein